MEIQERHDPSKNIKIYMEENGEEIARGFLFLIINDLHEAPYGFIEDIYIHEDHRGKGLGTEITKRLIEIAKREGCYKLLCTSRYARDKVHEFYKKFGFEDYGKEFRINF